jgi:putative endonuclease
MAVTKSSRSEAMQLEKKLKNLTKERINAFIEKYRSQGAGPDDGEAVSGC